MSCKNPLAGLQYVDANTGQLLYKVIGKYHPKMRLEADAEVLPIPCGKCLGCRLDYTRRWADRLIMELDHTGKGIFLTLTYNDENVPIAYAREEELDIMLGQTLDLDDVQKFMKRLRKHFDDREIRFYLAGEYGSTTARPHYHAIIFDLSLEDFFDCEEIGKNELGQEYYTSRMLTGIWKKGYTMMSEVSYNTCAYVSRYVMKKTFTVPNDYMMLPEDLQYPFQKEFNVMSRRPGIAGYYLEDHPEQKDLSKFFMSDQNGQVEVTIPSYVLQKVRDKDPDLYDKIIEERKEAASDADFIKTFGTELDYLEVIEHEYEDLLERTKVLKDCRK